VALTGSEELGTISGSWPRLSLAQVGGTANAKPRPVAPRQGRAISVARRVRAVFTALLYFRGFRHGFVKCRGE